VIDQVARNLNQEQKQALTVLARHVMTQLELRRHARELAAQRELHDEVKSDLSEARSEIVRLKNQLKLRKSALPSRRNN
jgi:hypothetical protein